MGEQARQIERRICRRRVCVQVLTIFVDSENISPLPACSVGDIEAVDGDSEGGADWQAEMLS